MSRATQNNSGEQQLPAPAAPLPLTPIARPGRSRTQHKITDTGLLTFDLVPYRVGDRVQITSVVNSEAHMEGVVTAYKGTSVDVNVDKRGGKGKYDDWLIELVTSAIPAPISPDETTAACVATVNKLDPVGGQVVGDFARAVIELTRKMDDERDLCHYVNGIAIVFKEDTFTCELTIAEKNCEVSEEELAALRDAANAIQAMDGRRTLRHLDLEEKTGKKKERQ